MNRFLEKYRPLYEGEGAGSAAGTAAAGTAAAAAAGAAKAWHDGIEADTIGFWQNKGYKVDDPKVLATDLTKQYRELERHLGAPPDQLLRMPKADAKPEDIKAFWQRLCTPADPKEYDFSGIKFNGEDLEGSFADRMRASLAAASVPKDKAAGIVKDVVKFLEEADVAESTVNAGKLTEEKARLTKEWGANWDFNYLNAMNGARRLGKPFVEALEKAGVGYFDITEGMRRGGAGPTEDTFVERGATSGGMPTTQSGAKARLDELRSEERRVGKE